MAEFKIKTAAGLLLIIIACLVVSILGYHAYTEGLTARDKRAQHAKASASKAPASKAPKTIPAFNSSFTPSSPIGKIVGYGYK